MRKRSVGVSVWLAFGALVLVAMVPKEIWIGLGVIGAIAFVAYLAIKHLGQKERRDAHRHEPTLAELIAKSEPQRSLRRPEPRPSGMPRTTIDANREHAQALRDRFPTTSPRTNEQISAPAHLAPPAPPPPRAPQNSISPADTPSGSQATKSPDQSAEWNATRQATVDAIRERAQALRDKFPPIPPRTSEQISAPVESTASPIALQPPTPLRVSERAITPSSPPAAPSPSSTTDVPAPNSEHIPGDFMRVLQGSPEPEDMYSATEITKPPLTHALPAAPAGFGEGHWVPPGESIEVAGVNLPGGMFYVGGRLKAPNGGTEPSLISGQQIVAREDNYYTSQMGYWPSYAGASPQARRAYLNWLSDGRSNPDCDIGYVFLFFYGLERRVTVDSLSDPAARNDWPAIIVELRRLLAIYGEKSGSFNRYAGELLSWIELDGKSSQLYKQPVPDFPRTYELPPYLRLALGQAAVDRAPLPAHLALAWTRLSPECYLRTAATRCPNEFERLFTQRYHEALGPGLVLPKNRTKLKFVYQAASASLRAANITMAFGDVPDVTALTAPIKKLMEIASQCTDELGSYSRLVGKDPGAAGALEGLLLLPATLWPAATQAKLRALTAQMREGRLSLPLKELLAVLGGANQAVNRDRARGLARALEGAEIGMEPHVLGGAKAPGEQDTIVLFAQPLMDSDVGSRAEYQMAVLTLQLASAVAQADGEFHDREIAHLRAEIEGWAHLTLAERSRLHAHLQWLTASPMNLAALKKKLEPLPIAAREMLAAFMATLAQADGFVSPDEVKFLEKIYKALGVEPKRVFSDIHAAGSGGTPVSTVQAGKQGFRLDAERIAALQEDTVRVSALLSKIFAEESDSTPAPAAPAPEPELEDEANAPLGLDQDHSALLRLLLSRPEWTRAELEDASADLDLMLDGAMEQINEAAFEAFDEPLFEGEDPISVNTKLLEKIEA
jgi:tellurite resistance protein